MGDAGHDHERGHQDGDGNARLERQGQGQGTNNDQQNGPARGNVPPVPKTPGNEATMVDLLRCQRPF